MEGRIPLGKLAAATGGRTRDEVLPPTRSVQPLTVLINAGPWLEIPPSHGYGGTENVIADLIPQLRAQGVRIVLATVGDSRIEVDEKIFVYQEGQYEQLSRPFHSAQGVALAHMNAVRQRLEQGGLDVVHNHMEGIGQTLLAAMGDRCPPSLHTLHDIRTAPEFDSTFDGKGRLLFNAISEAQLRNLHPNLRRQTIGVVPHGINGPPFAPLPAGRRGVLVLAAVDKGKGQAIAARVCARLGLPLTMAGPVGGIHDRNELFARLHSGDNELLTKPDVRYYLQQVMPLENEHIQWIGSVGGTKMWSLLADHGVLFSRIPGGASVMKALWRGLPVVACNLHDGPKVIEHARNGFLAAPGALQDPGASDPKAEQAIGQYLLRALGGEISAEACHQSVAHLSVEKMSSRYLEFYHRVIQLARQDLDLDARTERWQGFTSVPADP